MQSEKLPWLPIRPCKCKALPVGCAGCLDQSRAVERRNGAGDDGRGPVVACAPARGARERWTLGRGRPRGLGRARPDDTFFFFILKKIQKYISVSKNFKNITRSSGPGATGVLSPKQRATGPQCNFFLNLQRGPWRGWGACRPLSRRQGVSHLI